MASVNDEYMTQPNASFSSIAVVKNAALTTADRVNPLEGEEADSTRSAEPTQLDESAYNASVTPNMVACTDQLKAPEELVEQKSIVNEGAVKRITTSLREEPEADTTQSSIETENATTTGFSVLGITSSPPSPSDFADPPRDLNLVQLHGRHYDHGTPPPIPFRVLAPPSPTAAFKAKYSPKPDIGALQAQVAAKRIVEFRRQQALKAEKERSLESAWIQKRREIRRSNDAMHKELGVAGLSAQDHLRTAQHRLRQETKERELASRLERQNRWYNNTPKRPSIAGDHIRELRIRYHHAKQRHERTVQLKEKAIHTNQLKLQQRAHDIIVKECGEYVHGSYLLKVTHHIAKKPEEATGVSQMQIETES
ncbi:unnamed protein product [Phytophthora lilii]|uniref:Unnamed protein product n=1 Tax=Phytophthora lilii TaxID=2077276 RepID=A0A9W6TNC3_9STRA|nr:unnamed protein product [Phytophthora lilii]